MSHDIVLAVLYNTTTTKNKNQVNIRENSEKEAYNNSIVIRFYAGAVGLGSNSSKNLRRSFATFSPSSVLR